jgi:hypothetical protein
VFFGFFDYMLSQEIFPLWECNGGEMASFVGSLSRRLGKAGAVYGHGPVPNLEANRLRSVRTMLRNVCECDHALTSLSIGQSRDYLDATAAGDPTDTLPQPAPEQWAGEITRFFQHERDRDKSFGVMDNYFISPQEFLLAKRHLDQRGKSA